VLDAGHHWLDASMDIRPASAWSLDTYGSGPVLPYILSKAGINSTVIAVIPNLNLHTPASLTSFLKLPTNLRHVNLNSGHITLGKSGLRHRRKVTSIGLKDGTMRKPTMSLCISSSPAAFTEEGIGL
jgi:hypothetical protein